MALSRRKFLAAGTAAATVTMTTRGFAQWVRSGRIPDPSVRIVHGSFARYRMYVDTHGVAGG